MATVLFFGSVLVHELAHALVSEARGIRLTDDCAAGVITAARPA